MKFGSTGTILRVDLTSGTITIQSFGQDFYRLYPGGKALAAYTLLQEFTPRSDPLSPANILIFATGLLTGAPLSTATRFTVTARSPLTGAYGESEAGGFWGPELRMAGFDAIVITGRSSVPVYLWIRNGQVEIRDAKHLWGHEPEFVQATIRTELGDKWIRVLQTGKGGENLVRYAALTNELRHYNGRTGMGAVMGSKNLKAIAVRGTARYLNYAYDASALAELGRILAKQVKDHPQSWDLQVKGTLGVTGSLNTAGMLPTRNFREGEFEQASQLCWEQYKKEIYIGNKSCYACAIRCKREVAVNDRYQVSNLYGGPEYETVGGFGSNCGVGDLQAVAKANELCGRYTLDTISTGLAISFAMECFEHGLIGLKDTSGIELRFGDAEAMVRVVEMIAHRQGIGDLLAEGVQRAANKIGGEAFRFAMHVKGEELPLHDPRGKVAVGLGYAIGETGADHLVSFHDPVFANPDSVAFKGAMPLGIQEPIPARELSTRKAAIYARMENWSSVGKVIGLCYFGPAPRSFIQVDQVVAAVQAATGWTWDIETLLQIGERATNLARVFNIREGFSRKEDRLPVRLFASLENGPMKGVGISREEFERVMTDLYVIKGWDVETTVPTRKRLESLDLGWVADLLERSADVLTTQIQDSDTT